MDIYEVAKLKHKPINKYVQFRKTREPMALQSVLQSMEICALNQNSQLLVSEVIDKFTKIETTVHLCGPCKFLIITSFLL